MISNISKRYARAFFEIAGEEKKLEQYYNELHQFSSMMAENKDLGGFLANPIFEQDVKKNVLEKIIGKVTLSPMTVNFLKLLVDKNRIDVLPDIDTCYRLMMDEALQKTRVTVKTAFPLSADMQQYIMSNLKKLTGREAEVTVEDDKSLLGGIVIGVGDTLYDGSIKNQLNNMRNLLGEAR
ncbi:MAG: ATP synthase subunit delta [Deltaproteobacteria bacterium ADurb.Bin151]|nr:F0F1 ATP synthase subunit delta [Smithella sp.]OQB55058.1 MAG: ATP synthase subunit delta [Deltaproteobacteria bacterium ADurb.Bin151]HNZ10597.1 ATP synthase F1 subunit delta [Smithellaceae bacterium]HOG81484.1 ATP synthase F1 subunit delta [Smithellaceae bacterium]HOQ41793.1 ATP synthase F1 subunit delta [Smithellaceae bacterium]